MTDEKGEAMTDIPQWALDAAREIGTSLYFNKIEGSAIEPIAQIIIAHVPKDIYNGDERYIRDLEEESHD